MTRHNQKGMVQTVLGTIKPSEVGSTMSHEHLLIDFSFMFIPPNEEIDKKIAYQPVNIKNLGLIRQFRYSNLDNLRISDEQEAVEEMMLYKKQGGGTIIDATTIGIGRDPFALERISKSSGVNVVMGAGYYVNATHPADIDVLTEEELSDQITREITTGVGNSGIKAGIIGEIGCTWPLTPNEKKILRASANAQQKSGASILIHPGRNHNAPIEILNILTESGVDMSRVIMGHIDRTISSIKELREIAKTGCILEWDLFGDEVSYYGLSNFDMPNDVQRMNLITNIIKDGMVDQIVISQDICTKHRLVNYGGHGYGYILKHILPRMRSRGFKESEIHALINGNATRLLTIQ